MRNRPVVLAVALMFGLACNTGGEPTSPVLPPPAPPQATLTIETVTLGENIDPDGYSLVVDGATLGIKATDTVTVAELVPGWHKVSISGLSPNCRLPRTGTNGAFGSLPDEAWEESRELYIDNQGLRTEFQVTCYSVGTLKLVVVPAESSAVKAFLVVLTRDPRSQVLQTRKETTLTDVSRGVHFVRVSPVGCLGPITKVGVDIQAEGVVYDTVKAKVKPCY